MPSTYLCCVYYLSTPEQNSLLSAPTGNYRIFATGFSGSSTHVHWILNSYFQLHSLHLMSVYHAFD